MLIGMMSNKDHKKFIEVFKNKVHSIIALDIPNQINFMERYNFNIIEEKWQDFWDKNKSFKTVADKNKKKFYVFYNK